MNYKFNKHFISDRFIKQRYHPRFCESCDTQPSRIYTQVHSARVSSVVPFLMEREEKNVSNVYLSKPHCVGFINRLDKIRIWSELTMTNDTEKRRSTAESGYYTWNISNIKCVISYQWITNKQNWLEKQSNSVDKLFRTVYHHNLDSFQICAYQKYANIDEMNHRCRDGWDIIAV